MRAFSPTEQEAKEFRRVWYAGQRAGVLAVLDALREETQKSFEVSELVKILDRIYSAMPNTYANV